MSSGISAGLASAGAATVEATRVELDPEGRQEAPCDRPGDDAETSAFALAGP